MLQWFAPKIQGDSALGSPLVTLDAGPNVHVIVEKAHREEWLRQWRERFSHYSILEDEPGLGGFVRWVSE